jgi:outer membrane protein assembly factor BamB
MTDRSVALPVVTRRRFLQIGAPLTAFATVQLLAACQSPAASPTSAPATTAPAKPAAAGSPAAPAASPAVPAASPAASPVASPVASGAGGAAMYQLNAQHTGRSPFAGPRRAVLARTFDSAPYPTTDPAFPRADIQSSATIGQDGTIYIANLPGNLFALRDPGSGDRLEVAWRFHPARSTPLHGTPALGPDGTVYLGFSGEAQAGQTGQVVGAMYAVRPPASGTEAASVWSVELGPGRVSASPTIGDDGTIYAIGGPGRLTAISPAGQIRWTAQVGPASKASPAIGSDGTIYCPSTDGKLYAVAPPSGGNEGSVRWTFNFGEHLGPTPLDIVENPATGAGGLPGGNGIGSGASPMIAPDGMIYLGANNSNFYAIRPDGSLAWLYEADREKAGIWTAANLSADNQTLFFGANKGGVYALDRASGRPKWKFDIYGSVYASTALDRNGTLYAATTVGHLFALDSATGQDVFDYDAGMALWCAPAIRPDGSLFTADRNGRMMLFAAG